MNHEKKDAEKGTVDFFQICYPWKQKMLEKVL